MPKGIPIGFQMAEKNANTQTHTHTHFRIYISRDGAYISVKHITFLVNFETEMQTSPKKVFQIV